MTLHHEGMMNYVCVCCVCVCVCVGQHALSPLWSSGLMYPLGPDALSRKRTVHPAKLH